MAEQSLSECIDDLLECPICLECMADPRLLPCKQGHSFCDKCVHRLAISSLSLTTAACPLCRQEVPISDSGIIFTTRDITRAKLLDTNKRCEGNKQYCSKHSTERVRRFCKQCRIYVCCDCLVEGLHADHLPAVVGIGEAEEEMHTLLSQIGAKAFEQVKRLNAYRQDFINASKAEKEKLRLQVDKRLQELSDQLQADKQRLYNKIDNYVPSDVDPSVSVTHEQLQTLTEDVTGSLQVWTSLEEQCALYDRATSLWEGVSDVTLPPIHTSGIVRFVEVASVPCAGDIIPCQDNLRTSASNATQISRKRPPRPPPPEKSKTDVLGNSSATSLSSDAVVKAKNASALISERDQEPTVSPAAASISRMELRLSQPASQRQSTTAMRNTEDFNVTRRKQQNTNRPISTGLPITSRRGDVNRLSAVCDTPDHELTGRLCRHKSVGQLETKTSGCLLM